MTAERPEHRLARLATPEEAAALEQDKRHRILSRLRGRPDPATEARAAEVVAHLTEDQP